MMRSYSPNHDELCFLIRSWAQQKEQIEYDMRVSATVTEARLARSYEANQSLCRLRSFVSSAVFVSIVSEVARQYRADLVHDPLYQDHHPSQLEPVSRGERSQLAVDLALGNEPDPRVLAWKGDQVS